MSVEEMLTLCGWFTRWQIPGTDRVRYGARPRGGSVHQWFVGDTPREALEKMVAANGRLPNWELFE